MCYHIKTRATIGLLLLAAVGLMPTLVQAAPTTRHLKPPPESYLEYRVYTVNQLLQQVQDNPLVRRRYARHFQIPEDGVVSYMRANLVESYIPVTRRYTVYCVTRSGKFYPIKQTFRKGTKVFALRNGQPVLKWLCGNPLSRFLPAVVTKITRKPQQKVSPSIETLTENTDVLVPEETVPATFLSALPLGLTPASSLLSGGGGGFPALFLLPAALLFSNNGGGGGTVISHVPPPEVPEVPEPASPAYLLAALPAVALGMVGRRCTRGTKRSS